MTDDVGFFFLGGSVGGGVGGEVGGEYPGSIQDMSFASTFAQEGDVLAKHEDINIHRPKKCMTYKLLRNSLIMWPIVCRDITSSERKCPYQVLGFVYIWRFLIFSTSEIVQICFWYQKWRNLGNPRLGEGRGSGWTPSRARIYKRGHCHYHPDWGQRSHMCYN